MWIEPLTLTRREQEIGALLVKGYTRPEISAALGISAETVKKHTGNIVRKCNAANQREAASVLQMHEFVYGSTGLDADFFVLLRDTTLLIDNDLRTSHLRAKSIQASCKDNIVEKEGDVYCDGEIECVEINGERINPIREERGRFWYRHAFSPPVRRGQILHREVVAKMRDSFRFPRDYFFIEQPLPCKELRIGVHFGSAFTLEEVEFQATLGTHSYTPTHEDRRVGKQSIEWIVETPKILSCFTIRWCVSHVPTP